jgi:mannose-6-phosphate isomerase
MQRVVGVAHHYEWGDREFIPGLLHVQPDGRPWAELWFGTHPSAPSRLADGGMLSDLAGDLPYLVKILAAAEPLSLQLHPPAHIAAAGFAREEAAGIAIDDPRRIFRDPFAKPEILCALTRFEALCGFREPAASVTLLRRIGAVSLAEHLDRHGLRETVGGLYRGRIDPATTLAAIADSQRDRRRWLSMLEARYPGDASVVVALLLNHVLLEPGEAMFLGPGNLHAYLHGAGVEVMGSSDNVVRGGLTSKHIDVDTLLELLDVTPLAEPVLRPVGIGHGRWRYPIDEAPFVVDRLDVDNDTVTGPALVLEDGEAWWLGDGEQAVPNHGAWLISQM